MSGTSGTGRVAEVAEFDDGAVVVRWIGAMNTSGISSTTVFSSIEDLLKIHGHEGRTVVDVVLDAGTVEELERTVETLRSCLNEAHRLLQQLGVQPTAPCIQLTR